MNIYLARFLCVLLGYAFGSISCAYILGKLTKKIDIRDYGSGNAGTTNALRVLGNRLGMTVLVGDILKTVIALAITTAIFGYDQKQMLLWCGVGIIIGHDHPFYMQFKGGKGVAVMIGMFLFTDIRMFLLAGFPAILLLYFTRYVSLGSIVYMGLLIVTSLPFYIGKEHGLEVILLVSALAASVIIRHHANIGRLLSGTERKLGQKVSTDPKASETTNNK